MVGGGPPSALWQQMPHMTGLVEAVALIVALAVLYLLESQVTPLLLGSL